MSDNIVLKEETMELQELVERIQRWKERTSPEQAAVAYESEGFEEEEAEVETIEEGEAELLDSGFMEEVSEEEFDEAEPESEEEPAE